MADRFVDLYIFQENKSEMRFLVTLFQSVIPKFCQIAEQFSYVIRKVTVFLHLGGFQ